MGPSNIPPQAAYHEHEDALVTKAFIESIGGDVLLVPADLKDPDNCRDVRIPFKCSN